jgi:hypothetical protein
MDNPPSASPAVGTQSDSVIEKNRAYFADNHWYKGKQSDLETYRFISLCAARETRDSHRLLDLGNGGIFSYPIAHIPEVVAVDVFVEESFKVRYPGVEWRQMNALEMEFAQPFDTIIEINTLHHIIGESVRGTYTNLEILMGAIARNLESNGRAIFIESTVPSWFLFPYKILFPLLLKIWPLKHPPTFQFHFRDILRSAERQGMRLAEFCWVPKTSDIMTLGFQIKPWMSPVRIGKFVFIKP